MSRLIFFVTAFFLLLTNIRAADVDVSGKQLPKYRPALPGSNPDSFVNCINTKDLVAKHQADGLVYFVCTVTKTGEIKNPGTYGGANDTRGLEDEIIRCLNRSKFAPAVFEYEQVEVLFYGTVVFRTVDGKPRLRVFCTQEEEEMKKGSDFISPQIVSGHFSGFTGFHFPFEATALVTSGVVRLSMDVDANGQFPEPTVLSEDPPLNGFAQAVLADLSYSRCVPAFRDGKPVDSLTTFTAFFKRIR